MSAYQHLLVPIDGSVNAERAFEQALAIAKRNRGKIDLLAVIDTRSFQGIANLDAVEGLQKSLEQTSAMLEKLESRQQKISVTSQVLSGNPKQEIVKFAEKTACELIVMGATGLNAFEQRFVGSTTAYVVDKGPCTVMIVK
ncbi:universal stress protein [Enterococcus florum]|uniref:Universal stress protein n=1 Tax=Enterococcus florum TaxID=2480627 RepID=A0A4V0WPT9_9ENTE|nr:universal stress protein [Enterococcus florum]GCF95019.1 universal stress protein [Enterococcus florum]